MKESLIGGAESKVSIPNGDSGEKIDAEALWVKFKIMKQVVPSSPRINLECMGKITITIRLRKYGQPGPSELF